MQSGYALLMLCHKSKELGRSLGANSAASGLGELYAGLERVLRALENYSSAFEAIDGMRGKIDTHHICFSTDFTSSANTGGI